MMLNSSQDRSEYFLELWLDVSPQKGALCEYELFELCKPTLPPQRGCLRMMPTQSKTLPREMSCEHMDIAASEAIPLDFQVKGAINYRLCFCITYKLRHYFNIKIEFSFHHLHWVLTNVIFIYLLLLCFCLTKEPCLGCSCHLWFDLTLSILFLLDFLHPCLFILITSILSPLVSYPLFIFSLFFT